MKHTIFLILFYLSLTNCATEKEASNLIKPTSKGIKSITINYQDQEKWDKYIETIRSSISDSLPKLDYSLIEDDEEVAALKEGRERLIESLLKDYLFKDKYSKEYYNTYVDLEISQENWGLIINELKRPKKKKGIFSLTRNPIDVTNTIRISYDNGKETKVVLFLANYYEINGDWYYYGNRGGPNFRIIHEIIEKEGAKEASLRK
jgi:hypothetical protein